VRIAREGVRAGVERVVVAGGDGTLSEVVTGLLSADLSGYAEIAPLPLGTGGDFARTLRLPRQLEVAIEAISAARPRRVDAGRVRFRDHDGRDATAYFLNVASFGVSGLIVEIVNRGSKALGGRLSFLAGTLRGLASYRRQPVSLRVDGALVHEGPLVLAACANGRYFGGGMQVAPGARPDDGLLDVVVVGDVSKPRLLAHLPSIYRGEAASAPGVSLHRGRLVEAEAPAARVPIEVDGEPLGSLPLRIEIVPGAVSLLGPES
jgi:YegS/Rv2252/BmrU family lipid kinase